MPSGDWICQACTAVGPEKARTLSCALCSVRGGALRQTAGESWVHLSCAYWVPELGLSVNSPVWPVPLDLQRVSQRRVKLICSICKQRNVGLCIQCAKGKCPAAFHVECARTAGLFMETVEEDGEFKRATYCERHRPLELVRRIEEARRRGQDEVATFCRITRKCIAHAGEKRKPPQRAPFGRAEVETLVRRVKKACRKVAELCIRISRAGEDRYSMVQAPGQVEYSDTLDRRRFPWNYVKFDKFTAENCYRKYVELVPDEATFVREIATRHGKSKKQAAERGTTKEKSEVRYCSCQKPYHEFQAGHVVGISQSQTITWG